MKNNAEKFYHKFTVSERVELAIAALARNDMAEVNGLTRTCPKISCKTTNPEYSDKMIMLEKICFLFLIMCQELIYKIDMCLLAIVSIENVSKEKNRIELTEDKIKKLGYLREQSIIGLSSLYKVLLNFCDANNFNKEHVIRITGIEDLYPGEINKIISEQKIDEEFVSEVYSKFMKIWTLN